MQAAIVLLIRFSIIPVSLSLKCDSRASSIKTVVSLLNSLGPLQFTCTSLDRGLRSKLLLFFSHDC